MLVESASGYIWNFKVKSGKSQPTSGTVLDLLDKLKGFGHRVYMNNYYNSASLYQTLRLARGAPKDLQELSKKKQNNDNVMILLWKDKRIVNMVFTFHHASTIQKEVNTKKRGKMVSFTMW